jgi:hypothetical protein
VPNFRSSMRPLQRDRTVFQGALPGGNGAPPG